MGFPLYELTLKTGAVVILLRNLNVKAGLCNGARLLILEMKPHTLLCEMLTGVHKGEKLSLPRIKMQYEGTDLPFKLSRKQFPIRVCFTMTINKSEGQTFEKVGVLLEEPVFVHGQLYVAFSRTRSFNNLYVVLPIGKTCTKNVVYKEVLSKMHKMYLND